MSLPGTRMMVKLAAVKRRYLNIAIFCRCTTCCVQHVGTVYTACWMVLDDVGWCWRLLDEIWFESNFSYLLSNSNVIQHLLCNSNVVTVWSVFHPTLCKILNILHSTLQIERSVLELLDRLTRRDQNEREERPKRREEKGYFARATIYSFTEMFRMFSKMKEI